MNIQQLMCVTSHGWERLHTQTSKFPSQCSQGCYFEYMTNSASWFSNDVSLVIKNKLKCLTQTGVSLTIEVLKQTMVAIFLDLCIWNNKKKIFRIIGLSTKNVVKAHLLGHMHTGCLSCVSNPGIFMCQADAGSVSSPIVCSLLKSVRGWNILQLERCTKWYI